jgi:hypothetical protein
VPASEPPTAAIWLMPSAMPRSFAGKASVRMAALFEKRNPAPTPWTRRTAGSFATRKSLEQKES